MVPELLGIHHVTAITASATRNRAFYSGILGMRLVKKTVNQDDVSAYHLFYADAKGSPGTDLTFFDFGGIVRQRHGNSSITRTGLRVPGVEALQWWISRLHQFKVKHSDIFERDQSALIEFEDHEGQPLMLVADTGTEPAETWANSPVLPEFQIRGLGPVTLTVPTVDDTAEILTSVLGMRPAREYLQKDRTEFVVRVYEMAEGGKAREVHLQIQPDLPSYRPGAGGVHHVAFRVRGEEAYHAWARRLNEFGIPNSGEVDRYYFRSLYFREPNSILFELATDGPGFAVDEPISQLGERLSLPPFLESRRAQIEANLKELE
jgi:glyoxalase family protein